MFSKARVKLFANIQVFISKGIERGPENLAADFTGVRSQFLRSWICLSTLYFFYRTYLKILGSSSYIIYAVP